MTQTVNVKSPSTFTKSSERPSNIVLLAYSSLKIEFDLLGEELTFTLSVPRVTQMILVCYVPIYFKRQGAMWHLLDTWSDAINKLGLKLCHILRFILLLSLSS